MPTKLTCVSVVDSCCVSSFLLVSSHQQCGWLYGGHMHPSLWCWSDTGASCMNTAWGWSPQALVHLVGAPLWGACGVLLWSDTLNHTLHTRTLPLRHCCWHMQELSLMNYIFILIFCSSNMIQMTQYILPYILIHGMIYIPCPLWF